MRPPRGVAGTRHLLCQGRGSPRVVAVQDGGPREETVELWAELKGLLIGIVTPTGCRARKVGCTL